MNAVYKYVRFLAYTIEILVFFVLERIPNLLPSVNGVRPIILVPIVILISLFEGPNVGVVFGFFAGMLLDIGASGTFGFYSAAMACIGFLVGKAAQKIIKFDIITSVAVVIAGTAAFYAAHFLVEFLFRGYYDALYALVNHYLVAMLYTVSLSPLTYFFNKALAVNINAAK